MAPRKAEDEFGDRCPACVTKSRETTAKILDLSVTTVDKKTKDGSLGHCRVGRRVFYLDRHIDEFLARAEEEAKAAVEKRKSNRLRRHGAK